MICICVVEKYLDEHVRGKGRNKSIIARLRHDAYRGTDTVVAVIEKEIGPKHTAALLRLLEEDPLYHAALHGELV